MGVASGAVGRWTRAFVALSAGSFVLLAGLRVEELGRTSVAVVGLFGFVLPMVFGMGYVLLPPYLGRTIRDPWLAGVHVGVTSIGLLGLFAWTLLDAPFWLARVGFLATAAGIGVFGLALARTIGPALRVDAASVLRLGDRPQRTTRLATAALPIALGFLFVAAAILALASSSATTTGLALPVFVHLAGSGFAALLVFALGARLLLGFFHVEPPRWLLALLLIPAVAGPLLLAALPAGSTGFLIGGGLESLAMVAYLALVALVVGRTERRRVGLVGILLGACAGVAAVGLALLGLLGIVSTSLLDQHAILVLRGFFGLTIAGYAFQFFPVTGGHVAGASRRGALAVVALLATGLAGAVLGQLLALDGFALAGRALGVGGALGYAYLITTRLARDASR